MPKDIYFHHNYGKLYEQAENGIATIYVFSSAIGKIVSQFIKRPIEEKVDGVKYYDLVTPYGYGGPYIESVKEGHEQELVNQFEADFRTYCTDNNIVSEFIRFHPILQNADMFQTVYEIQTNRKTVGTNLQAFDDPVQSEFSKSCRKNIRRSINSGVTHRIVEKPKDIEDFKKIYQITMKRNEASDFYYFNEAYFSKLFEWFHENLLLVEALYEGRVIAAGLYFISEGIIHIHLSGTLDKYLHLSPAYILRYAVTIWGKENGYDMIHHGGGRTNHCDDSLYTFKKQFGKNTEFDFKTGKRIWNDKVYNVLVEQHLQGNPNPDPSFFPLYRL